MSKKATAVSASLISYFDRLDRTRKKLEWAFSAGHVRKKDIEKVYDGLYLNAIGAFENFIEELFFGLILKKLKVTGQVRARVAFMSVQAARTVILNKQPFLKWLPYNNTNETAGVYLFNNGFPFSRVVQADIDVLKKISWIRNAIAHKSRSALDIFEDKIIGSLPLTRSEKTPAGYLRGKFRIAPVQTRYEEQIIFLAKIANKLAR